MSGNDTANTIVTNDTQSLINQADNIVRSCTGTNCNTSITTRRSITENSSLLAQQQSTNTLSSLGISSSSVLGRQINDAYLDLGSSVSSVYNYQCGNSTVNSTQCVTSASSVNEAQNNLESLLTQPASDNTTNIVVVSILASIGLIFFILFVVFLIIGFVEKSKAETKQTSIKTCTPCIQTIPQQTVITGQTVINPVSSSVPIPASPFDITEPVYE